MTDYLYRLTLAWPPEWHDGLPAEVLEAVRSLHDPYRTLFTDEAAAYKMRKFWRRMGAQAEVLRSDPVTWPERAGSSEKEVAVA
jgi:hypothetical protein